MVKRYLVEQVGQGGRYYDKRVGGDDIMLTGKLQTDIDGSHSALLAWKFY